MNKANDNSIDSEERAVTEAGEASSTSGRATRAATGRVAVATTTQQR